MFQILLVHKFCKICDKISKSFVHQRLYKQGVNIACCNQHLVGELKTWGTNHEVIVLTKSEINSIQVYKYKSFWTVCLVICKTWNPFVH